MLSLFKRYYELLVVSALLIVPFAIFLTRGHRGREPIFLDRVVIETTTPLENALSWFFDGIGAGWHGYIGLRGVRQENASLHADNGTLRERLHELEEAKLENERLRRILGYTQVSGGPRILARVAGVNPDPENPSLRINRGESDGVQRGMAVVTPDGVVGQIQRVTAHAADVLLLIDPKSRVGVRVQRSRARAIVGLGMDHVLRLEYALKTDSMEEGDVVITSGTDAVYPAGLVVGKITKVTRVDRLGNGAFQAAEIVPAVDITRLEEIVLLPGSTFVPGSNTGSAPGADPAAVDLPLVEKAGPQP